MERKTGVSAGRGRGRRSPASKALQTSARMENANELRRAPGFGGVLYGDRVFACRQCRRLTYESQQSCLQGCEGTRNCASAAASMRTDGLFDAASGAPKLLS